MAKWVSACPDCGAIHAQEHSLGCPRVSIPYGGYVVEPTTEGRKDDGYDILRDVLQLAVDQASVGKGKERHANGKPFDRQPIMEIGRMVGSGYPLGQAMKKAQESSRLPPDRAKAELLGAINYLAAAYLLLE